MKIKWFLWGIAITPFIGFISIFFAGAGHGTVLPLTLMYPALFLCESYAELIIWYVVLIQFPLYGIIIDFNNSRINAKKYNIILLLFHILLILVALMK
jgi:hypothetical protein